MAQQCNCRPTGEKAQVGSIQMTGVCVVPTPLKNQRKQHLEMPDVGNTHDDGAAGHELLTDQSVNHGPRVHQMLKYFETQHKIELRRQRMTARYAPYRRSAPRRHAGVPPGPQASEISTPAVYAARPALLQPRQRGPQSHSPVPGHGRSHGATVARFPCGRVQNRRRISRCSFACVE
jgi:hypothetical protein